MFGLFKKKSKAEIEYERYKVDILKLKSDSTDPGLSEEERETARRKLRKLQDYHTQKINGGAEEEAAKHKEEKDDGREEE